MEHNIIITQLLKEAAFSLNRVFLKHPPTYIQILPHTARCSVCKLTQTWAMCLWEQFARLVTYGFRAYYGKLQNRRLDAACSLRVRLSPFIHACVDGKSFTLA